ncbi:MAG TPA: hypothetical protein VG055_17495 [Planctomycetaceae bacterium]|jgi:hypothetical protein|nr:hypothetical protein [Planctomycetaceae bacterium]
MGRFTVASVVAIGLIIVGAISVRIAQAYGASLGGSGTGVELPSLAIWGIWLTDVMVDFWWFLIPLVFILCFGTAMMFRSAGPTPNK